jgi:hypothetical protein
VLGTAALEVATALVAIAAIWRPRADVWPFAVPVALLAAAHLAAAAPAGIPGAIEAGGRVWPLALALALPRLEVPERALRVGLVAAALVAVVAIGQAVAALAAGDPPQSRGFFSHHLTLGYALLPPLAFALHHRVLRRQPALAAALALGVLSSGGTGPAISLLVVVAGRFVEPRAVLAVAAVAVVAATSFLSPQELGARPLLWASGAEVAVDAPVGAGSTRFVEALAIAQDELSPGFHFPLHAHDAALQVGVLLGLSGWLAWAVFLVALWERTDRSGRVALAALLVGGLTQDTFGDLEVTRALTAWALGTGAAFRRSETASATLEGR